MSKDDAWVDILISGTGKRMANQDAEMRPRGASTSRALGVSGTAGSGAGRSDPDLASMEVAQALANVRQMSPSTDDEGDRDRDASSQAAGDVSGNGNGHSYSSADIDGEEDDVPRSPPKRRLGYFDLHPDRRPPGNEQLQAGQSSMSGYDESVNGTSIYSEGDFEPATSIGDGERRSDADMEVPAFVESRPVGGGYEQAKIEPTTAANGNDAGASPSPATQSKTAGLIEMYRERERQSTAQTLPSTPPLQIQKPSRLPVRSSSLPQDKDVSSKPATTQPTDPSSSTPLQSISPDLEDDEGEDDITGVDPVQPYVLGELGRSSPMRYIHGAPLHNVLEEEEEET